MEGKKFQLSADHRPLGICEVCLGNEKLTRSGEHFLISYCPHSRTVGVLTIRNGEPAGPWRMMTPVDLNVVNQMLEQSNSFFEDIIRKSEENELAQMPAEAFHQA